MVQQLCKLSPQEATYNGRRCFITPQTMCIASTHNGCFQQTIMAIYSHQRFHNECHKTQVLFRSLTWCMEQYACIGSQTPVLVLTTSIDACKRFLMEQHSKTMISCNTLHQGHQHHIVVNRQVTFLVDRCQLKLVWCHLIMASFARNSQLQRLYLQVLHECLYTVRDCTKIMVIHLLIFSALMPHQGSARQHQIWACRIESFIYQEILLFPSKIYLYLSNVIIEQTANICCRFIYCMKCPQQRSFVVQSFACIGNKDSRDAECIINNEHRTCWVPSRITTSLKGVANTTIRETGSIWLLLNKEFPREHLHHTTLAIVLYKSIMLFSRTFCQRLEPMGVMGCAHFHSPLLHALGYLICNATV